MTVERLMREAATIREDLGDDVRDFDLIEMVEYITNIKIVPGTVAERVTLVGYNANTTDELEAAIKFWTGG
jgi:hypothetical protein